MPIFHDTIDSLEVLRAWRDEVDAATHRLQGVARDEMTAEDRRLLEEYGWLVHAIDARHSYDAALGYATRLRALRQPPA